MNHLCSKILLVVLLLPMLAHAKTAAHFVQTSTDKLENQIRSKYDIKDVLEKISQLRSYESWPADMDPNFKFYIAIEWSETHHITESFALLTSLKDATIDRDLWQFYLASTLFELGQTQTAASIVDEIAKKMPGDADVMFLQSTYLAQLQKYDAAAKILTEVLRSSPDNGKAYLQRALVYIYSLSNDMALKDLKKAIQLLPEKDLYHRQMAYLQAGLIEFKYHQNTKKAEKFFNSGIRIDPNSELVMNLKQRSDLY